MNETYKKDIELDNWAHNLTDLDDFIDAVDAIQSETKWTPGVTTSGLRVEAMDGPIEAEQIARRCGCSYAAAYDTGEGTKLMLKTGFLHECLRDTAMPSLFRAAKVNGPALGRMSQHSLKEVLNYCLEVANGQTLVMRRGEKVSALMSDNNGGYKIMPQDELVEIALRKMHDKFGSVHFIGGSINHNVTSFLVELPDAKEKLTDAYNEIVGHSGRTVDLMPAVRFMTSDTGYSAATLLPLYRDTKVQGIYFPVNQGLKVEHDRTRKGNLEGVEKFAVVAGELHAKFNDTNETIAKMAATTINHPLNAYILMTQKAGIAKKYSKEGYTDLENYTGLNPCSMHDIYLSATRAIGAGVDAGLRGSALISLEDSVAKLLTMKWEDFDIPGMVAWNVA